MPADTIADPIPAVRESEATGDVAACFADLRATLALPFVNLIWRHLATVPNGLAAVWTTVRPLYVSPELPHWAAELRAQAQQTADLALPNFVFDAAGIGRAARAEIGALIADYDTGNSHNYLALIAFECLLRGENSSVAKASCIDPPATVSPLKSARQSRPLPGLDKLEPDVLALVLALDGLARPGASAAVASLYRHLAHWPGFLALSYARLQPLDRDGRLDADLGRIEALGHTLAREHLLAELDSTHFAALDQHERAFVGEALDEFIRRMIGRMIVMGGALRALMPPSE